jgi:sugar O-acyltransferase (sialic acid O-acetyltransferase NeuD family)
MGEAKPIVIYGAGGHGKVVLDALERGGRRVVGFVDDDSSRAGGEHCGLPVFASLGTARVGDGVDMIVAIGDPVQRERTTARVLENGWALAVAVHPSAVIAPDVEISPGVMILACAVINPGSRVGRGAIINTGAVVDHDCSIGDFAHIAPGVRLAGSVSVGARAVIGVGATVIPGVTIGDGSIVGAGAAVIADVQEDSTVVGVPARAVVRAVSPERDP